MREAAAADAARRPLVLVIDDDALTRETIITILQEEGLGAHGAASGDDALRIAPALRPNVLLVDLQMPGLDGFELARRVRALPALACTRLVAMSALASTVHPAERALAAGADAFLAKPFGIEGLLAAVRGVTPPDGDARRKR